MFKYKDFLKLFENYKSQFLLKIKQEKNNNYKLLFFYNYFKNKNKLNNNIIKNVNYGIILFIIINIIIFIFLFFYLYSVDIMLYLYPDKIISYLNINIDKDAAGFTFLGAFLPFSHYFVSLKNLYVGVFLDYKKKVYNRTVLLLQFLHKNALRPLTKVKKRKKSSFMKIFLSKYSVREKIFLYSHYASYSYKYKSMNSEAFTKVLEKDNGFWSLYYIKLYAKFTRRRANPLFDSHFDNLLNRRAAYPILKRYGNCQDKEFYAQDPNVNSKHIKFIKNELINGMKSYYNVRPEDIEKNIRENQKIFNYFIASRSTGSSEDYLFFKNFFFNFKFRLENAFYKKTINKLGEFYIYYLDLTSDKILFNIYVFFEYIWSFFFNKIKSFFFSFFFFIIYYYYYNIVPLFIFLYSLQLSQLFSFFIIEFLGYLKLGFSYISGEFVYYYLEKGTYYSIYHSSSFGLLILLILKMVFFFFLLYILLLLLEDYFNEMQDTLRLPLEVLGLSFILIIYAFFISFQYLMGPISI